MSFSTISPRIRDIIEKGNLYALRDRTGRLYNVSYSEEGLKWTTRLDEKPIMFKDARFTTTVAGGASKWVSDHAGQKPMVIIYGNTERNPFYVVEHPYVPKDHFKADGRIDAVRQKDEYLYSKKALMLLS